MAAHTFLWVLLLSNFLSYGHCQEKAVLTLEPDWSPIFTGETVTFTCDMKEGPTTDWLYIIENLSDGVTLVKGSVQNKHSFPAQLNHSGQYNCLGTKTKSKSSPDPNGDVKQTRPNLVTLTVSDKPKATLKADQTVLPVEGSVTLTCSVEGSSGWKYYLNQNDTLSLIDQYSTGSFNVSEGGRYRCRGGRGAPETLYYTDYSDPKTIVSPSVSTAAPLPGSTITPPSVTEPAVTSSQTQELVVGLSVGVLVVVILLTVLVLLLRRCTSKDSCCVRSVKSQGTNQDSAAVQSTNQSGRPGDDKPTAESADVTYAQVELKRMSRKSQRKEKFVDPFESSLYSEVKTDKEADVTYVQVNYQHKDKAYNKRAAPDQSEDTVYSQVKAGTSRAAPEQSEEDTVYSQVKAGTSRGL